MAVMKFTKENVAKISNGGGVYKLYDKEKKPVYVGMTAGNKGKQWGPDEDDVFRYGLRHRLQSYYQKDDRREHPTKPALRKDIHYFQVWPNGSDRERSKIEKREKNGLKHNHL